MADDPIERLEAHARKPVPPVDAAFADRLESQLRAQHATESPRRWRGVPGLLPRLGVAAVVAAAAIVGIVALNTRDAGVPVAVVEGETPLASQPSDAGTGADQSGVAEAATATPTPTVQNLPSSASDVATPTPTPTSVPQQDATPIVPAATPVVAPTPSPEIAEPSPTPIATLNPEPSPTPTVAPQPVATVPSATPRPAPTPPPTPTQTPRPEATPTATPTVAPEPRSIDLTCRRRTAGDAVGVICEWRQPITDGSIVQYEVWRSRNGSDARVVSRQRGTAATQYVDRDIAGATTVAYLVRALDAEDRVVAASERVVVSVAD